jgi:hypothetical protein
MFLLMANWFNLSEKICGVAPQWRHGGTETAATFFR